MERLEVRRVFTDIAWPAIRVEDGELRIHTSVDDDRSQIVIADGGVTLHLERTWRVGAPPYVVDRTLTSAELGPFTTAWVNLSAGNDVSTVTSDVRVTVDAGRGHDRVTLAARQSRVIGGAGNDVIRSLPSVIPEQPESTTVKVVGRARFVVPAAEVIGWTANSLEGGAGKDTFYTSGGVDVVRGGSGRDRVILLGRGVEAVPGDRMISAYVPEARVILASQAGTYGIERIEREQTQGLPILSLLNEGLPNHPFESD